MECVQEGSMLGKIGIKMQQHFKKHRIQLLEHSTMNGSNQLKETMVIILLGVMIE